MADTGVTQARTAGRWLRFALAEARLLAFLPLCVMLAWWSGQMAVLFVVSFMFPMLLALQELMRPGGATTEAAEVQCRTGTAASGRHAALAHLATLVARTRLSGDVTALLLIDIDDFRRINLRHGMAAGDALLVEAGARLRAASRPADLTLALGGDRFAVILAPVPRARFETLCAIAERLQAALARPMAVVGGATLKVTASVGLCLSGRAPEDSAEAMFQAAEAALAEAKRMGPGATRSFSPRMRQQSRLARALAAETEAALTNGQISPWFQPQVCTDDGTVSGFEALARWEHPEHGILEPDAFLPGLIAAGQAARLGETVLHHALSALRGWDGAGLDVPSVSVNFSTEELRDPGLCERLKWAIDRFDLAPGRLMIELTETTISASQESLVVDNVRGLAGYGFGIDLDNFGTGTASILNLRRYPVRRIKIDRALLGRIEESAEQQRFVTAVLRLAESLGIDVLAEGVETPAAQSLLAQLGCRYIQGFGLARPMPYDATLPWLHEHAAATRSGMHPPDRRAG